MDVKKESGVITVQIQIQEAGRGHQILSFTTERCLPMRRVFLDLCDRLDLVYGTVRFLKCEGDRVCEDKTAEECGIQDGDLIDAVYEQIGGGPTCT